MKWLSLSTVVLAILLAGFIYTIWHIRKGHQINPADMFKGPDGRASATRFIALGGWVFSTWLMVVLVEFDPDGIKMALEFGKWYLGICVAGYAANKLSESIGGK